MLDASLTKKLWHFTLEVQLQVDNQILVLLGPSGCGKTTTLALLAGLFKPDKGFIKLNNQTLYSSEDNINKPPQSRDIGYLFQNYALFPHMTVRQNVFYGLKSKRYRQAGSALDPVELLDSFGVGHLIDRYPSMLSGGEKQRVALARALIVQPKLLLLDEPFSALDRNTKTGLRKELKKLHRQWQIPFVLVTHDEEDARFLGDIIVTIENGRVRNRELRESPAAAYCGATSFSKSSIPRRDSGSFFLRRKKVKWKSGSTITFTRTPVKCWRSASRYCLQR